MVEDLLDLTTTSSSIFHSLTSTSVRRGRGLFLVARESTLTVTSETSTLIAMTGHRDDVRMRRKGANQLMKKPNGELSRGRMWKRS